MKTKYGIKIGIGMVLVLLSSVLIRAESTDVFQSGDYALVAGGISELNTESPFNSVTLFTPDGSPLPELSYENERGGWEKLELAHSHGVPIVDMTDMVLFAKPQDKILIRSDKNIDVKAHFFFTQIENEVEEAEMVRLESENQIRPQFISRDQWLKGIETTESATFDIWEQTRMVKQNSSARVRAKLIQPEDDLYAVKELDDESDLFAVDGENSLPRITVHHTVTPQSRIFDPYATVRAIYQYHTYTRGWGDIGYHYLISPDGLIFEGAKNGPTKSGTHVADRNFNNIGISLMGNFQGVDKPTDAQLEVLSLLIADHALRFSIDPMEITKYFGREVHRVAGHRDVASLAYGTACPGDALHAMLPQIRDRAIQIMDLLEDGGITPITARDFLQKSSIAPKIQGRKVKLGVKKEMPITMYGVQELPMIRRGIKGTLEVKVQNNTKTTWPAEAKLLVSNVPEGMLLTDFHAAFMVEPGEMGVFRAKYLVSNTSNGTYELQLDENFLDQTDAFRDRQKSLAMKVKISGDRDFLLTSERETQTAQEQNQENIPSSTKVTDPEIKIKLEFFKERYADIVGSSPVDVFEGEKYLFTAPAGEGVKVVSLWDEENKKTYLQIVHGDKVINANSASVITTDDNGYLTIRNYNRGLGPSHAYNEFRKRINIHIDGRESIIAVNQLPIKLYMRGLSEEPAGTPIEKRKAINLLAETYAWVYSQTDKRKYNTPLYDGSDDPASFQYYLGYEWERYHAEQTDVLKATEGQLVTYNGKPVITPYHTCSGGYTSDKWSSSYPWTKSQHLPWDENCVAAGHGVGLSGWSAYALAEQGYTYEEIVHYFYDGIEITKAF